MLATYHEVRFRDPKRAVALAKKAVELKPQEGSYWNTLGVAQYRCGSWKAAVAALEKSIELGKAGDSSAWFFLSMAHWQLGDKEAARKSYDKAVQWMNKHQSNDEALLRFQAEAEALLGVEEKKG